MIDPDISQEQWWDCHFHIFDNDRYTLSPDCAYVPENAYLSTFRQLSLSRGIQRGVLVHPSVYGADHTSFEDTLSGNSDWLRGVAVVSADENITSDAQIESWNELGACGTRINRLFPGAPANPDRIIDRVRALGWHVQLLVDIVQDMSLIKHIANRDMPVVVDHFGHSPADHLLRRPEFLDLLALMREGNIWIKLSAPYRLHAGDAPWSNTRGLVDMFVKANPYRLVWGSDWPHPQNHKSPFIVPKGNAVHETIHDWFSDSELRRLIMSSNPASLYR